MLNQSTSINLHLRITCVFIFSVLTLLLTTLWSSPATAAAGKPEYELSRFTAAMKAAGVFPGADQFGNMLGEPPVTEILSGGELIGYVFLNSDFVNSTGYSGKPIHQLIAIDLDGIIRRVLLVEHHEPIVLIGIPEARITAVLENYVGLDIGVFARDTDRSKRVLANVVVAHRYTAFLL